jgi:hypothetical protein
MNKGWLWLAAVLLLAYLAAPAVQLTVYPKFALKRSDIRYRVRIAEDENNRLLKLIADGPEYRAQDIPLEGLESPRIIERWLKDIPPGRYVAIALVVRAGGKQYMARDEFCIAGPDIDCQ